MKKAYLFDLVWASVYKRFEVCYDMVEGRTLTMTKLSISGNLSS